MTNLDDANDAEDRVPIDYAEPRVIVLTDAQIDAIAGRVEQRFYQRVGKKVVEKALMVIGLGVLALMAYLGGKGMLK
jgi:hypothetical protein